MDGWMGNDDKKGKASEKEEKGKKGRESAVKKVGRDICV